ncbi:ABC-three component system middle component 5 [Sandarakinorhabdus cyanobacteriorum]
MAFRIWYPQLDVFDCIRRVSVLASLRQPKFSSMERMLIGDFFLANPPLLHNIAMPSEVRKLFMELKICRPEKVFLSYPAAPLLFHKMEPVQRRALKAMAAKNLLDRGKFDQRQIDLTDLGRDVLREQFDYTCAERELAQFIAIELIAIGEDSIEDLRKRTGLRRLSA